VALVFGLLQFVHDVLHRLALRRYMNRNVDPLARDLERRTTATARRPR
jgi:muconolactone delta-isomerase